MLMFCGDADCEGKDNKAGIYCPCRKSHYSIDEIMFDVLLTNNLVKGSISSPKFWNGCKWVSHSKWEEGIKKQKRA